MSPRPNFRGRLRPALIFELGRIGSEHLPNDLPRDPKLPADRLDRPLLNEIRPADLRNRLHDQHPELGLHVPWKPVWTLIPGVPFGCRSPRKRGPYSTPVHNLGAAAWPRPDPPFRSRRSICLRGLPQADAVCWLQGLDEPQGRLL